MQPIRIAKMLSPPKSFLTKMNHLLDQARYVPVIRESFEGWNKTVAGSCSPLTDSRRADNVKEVESTF